jgi:hypothetical protein
MKKCAILFSGGTDSTCSAALCAEEFDEIHLLTFYEKATARSPVPTENLQRLRDHFREKKFSLATISTDRLVQKLSYENYFPMLWRHGLFMLSTPGFSSLSWHIRTIAYCLENGIEHAFDGMTKELLHFPGHMKEFRSLVTDLYAQFGIAFSSPVINWPVPIDQRFVDRLIVDRHGFLASKNMITGERTTGQYLYDKQIFPHPNVKGSFFDHRMQHDCYPFVVFNIFVFWVFLGYRDQAAYERRIEKIFSDRIKDASLWLKERQEQPIGALFAPPNQLF